MIPLISIVGVGVLVAQAVADSPWWIAVVVVPLAGFAAWMVRYTLDQQRLRDANVADREKRREDREEKRAEQADAQTNAMQACVVELRSLHTAQLATREAIDGIPDRVLQRMEQRRHE